MPHAPLFLSNCLWLVVSGLLIANNKMARPETRTFGYFAPELRFRGFFFQHPPVFASFYASAAKLALSKA